MQYIYTLSSPENPEIIKYVGYTNNPNRRYNKHLHSYKRGFSKIKCWIKSLHLKNLKPIMSIIDERETVGEIKKLEINYITLYKSFGANLKNDTVGGEGTSGYKHSEETKLKISKNNARSMLGKRKYNINDNDVKKLFLEGKTDSEIANILKASKVCIKESRKRQHLLYPKKELKPKNIIIIKLTSDILKKYYIDENKSKKEISELTGVTERNIKKRLKDWKINKTKEQFTELMNRVRRKTKLTEELKIKIKEDRKNKVTVKEMSEKYNISKNTINNFIYKK